jgi:hypothetical protein
MNQDDTQMTSLQDQIDTAVRERDDIAQRIANRRREQSADNDRLLSLRETLIKLLAMSKFDPAALAVRCSLPVAIVVEAHALASSGDPVSAADLLIRLIDQRQD